jgi:hypothetical protein
MSSPNTNKLTELEIVIPKDKFNDMGFIFRKLMETSLDVLDTIAKNSDKNLVDLAREFLPDLKNLSQPDIFLSKWGLNMSMLNSGSTEAAKESKNTTETVAVEEDVVSTASSVSSKKKIKKTLKLSKKPKKTIEKQPVQDVTELDIQDTTEAKPVVKKLKKIKLSRPTSSTASVSSASTSSNASSGKPKKKLKLKLKKMKLTTSD